ncbi:hypothetical protein AB0D47_17305 [Streptomyces sp. NPDC048376]|uniref:hypothetical protein n=2 Tax=unclassified Streptomyces TaxID=2593676 RepID=UPI00342953E0
MNGPARYRVVEHDTVLTFGWELRGRGDDVELVGAGHCPVCGCPMTVTYGYYQPIVPKGGFLGRRREPTSSIWYTRCRCEGLHMPRPANVPDGCGAGLRLARPQDAAGIGG